MSETTERGEPAAVGVSPLEAVVSLPWRIDQDNDRGLCVVDARGEIVYVEDWGGIPDEMSSGMREQIIEQARANARFMVAASVAWAGNRIDVLTQERDALREKLAEVDADRADAWANESAWRLRAEAAESELAAMRAKWDAAPTAFVSNKHSNGVPDSICPTGELPADWWGKRVRLVVEDDTP